MVHILLGCRFDIQALIPSGGRRCLSPFGDQVQYLKVLSVRILANISPSGRAMMIMMAAANQDTASESDMIPKLYIAR